MTSCFAVYGRLSMYLSDKLGDIRTILSTFFRSVGLDLPNVLARRRTRISSTEPKKIVIKGSRWIALARCGVHILPILFTIVLVALNLKHYLIEYQAQDIMNVNLALLQIPAKIQELLIVASTSTIVFDLIRSELLNGYGVPLGLLGSGFSFKDISWFWSPDFWCSVGYQTQWYRKIFLLVTLVLAGLLAVMAGPATAVLVIPRMRRWPAGGSSFFLQGNEAELWPSYLNYTPDEDSPLCRGSDPMRYGICPSGGYYAFLNHYAQVNISNFMNHPAYDWAYGDSPYDIEINDPTSQIPRIRTLGGVRSEGKTGKAFTFFTQPQIASLVFLKQLTADWWHAAQKVSWSKPRDSSRYHHAQYLQTNVLTQNPQAIVGCSTAQNVSTGLVASVWFPGYKHLLNETLNVFIPEYNINLPHSRFSWVPLNASKLRAASTGALFTFFSVDDDDDDDGGETTNQTQYALAIACTVRANWLKTSVRYGNYNNYAFTSAGIVSGTARRLTVSEPWLEALTPLLSDGSANNATYSDSNTSGTSKNHNYNRILANTTNATYPNSMEVLLEQIQVLKGGDLADMSDNGSYNGTMVEKWNEETFAVGGNRTTFLESLLAAVFTDGLSRTNSVRAFSHTDLPFGQWPLWSYDRVDNFNNAILQGGNALKAPSTDQDVTESRMNATIEGYSYHASSTTDFLAIAVVLFHCLAALAHTIYCMIHGVSSGCWDTVTEILTLALGSPADGGVPESTGAGIKTGRTFKEKAWVRVKQGRVVLIFETEAADDGSGNHDVEVLEETKTSAEIGVESTSSSNSSVREEERPLVGGNLHALNLQPGGRSTGRLSPCGPFVRKLRPLRMNRAKKKGNPNFGQSGLVMELDKVELDVKYA